MVLYVEMLILGLLSEGITITNLGTDCEARDAADDQSTNETEIGSRRCDIHIGASEARVVLLVRRSHHAHARHIAIRETEREQDGEEKKVGVDDRRGRYEKSGRRRCGRLQVAEEEEWNEQRSEQR